MLAAEKGDVEGCCINGGMRGLFLAYQNAITESRGEVRVNLLLSAGNRSLEVVSFLPYEGRLDLYPATSRPILLRCPGWVRPERIRIESESATHMATESEAARLRITGAKPGSHIVLRFEQPEGQHTHWVGGRAYHARWRGDTVIEMLPGGGTYPIFTRSSLDREQAPIQPRETSYQVPRVHW